MLGFQLKQCVLTVSTSAMAPDVLPTNGLLQGGGEVGAASVSETPAALHSVLLKIARVVSVSCNGTLLIHSFPLSH